MGLPNSRRRRWAIERRHENLRHASPSQCLLVHLEIMEIEFRNFRIAEADLQSKVDELLAELRDKVTPDQPTPDGRPPGLR